ncbi:hypothetical protein BDV28DRAFT_134839 [Aspergillus coremiiformis]|uniref:Uncharacterized protein n=1 Tax=Aspergillus coremiiformis TaxID=138285 RepID=A0A5N6Z4L2_9EURO|nr:hypothetical protein BDV28DRAFT_134839 [Aspergillus coremiiformis]
MARIDSKIGLGGWSVSITLVVHIFHLEMLCIGFSGASSLSALFLYGVSCYGMKPQLSIQTKFLSASFWPVSLPQNMNGIWVSINNGNPKKNKK